MRIFKRTKKRQSIQKKMLIYIFFSVILIFGSVLFYSAVKSERAILNQAKKLTENYTELYSRKIQAKLGSDLAKAEIFCQTLKNYENLSVSKRFPYYRGIMEEIIKNNPEFVAVWISWERSSFDPNWGLPYGRARNTVYRTLDGTYEYISEMVNLDGDDPNGDYFKSKKNKREFLTSPYWFNYQGNSASILETSIAVPILNKDKFVGLAGMDIELQSYQDMINSIIPILGSKLFLISNNGAFVSHYEDNLLGKSIEKYMPQISEKYNLLEHIEIGDSLFFNDNNNYYIFYPIKLGHNIKPWSVMLQVPVKNILADSKKIFFTLIIVGVIGLIILLLIVWFISLSITRPVRRTTKVLSKLSYGDLSNIQLLKFKSNDELEDMANSLNTLTQGLNHTADFAKQIGEGNLDAQYDVLSDKDTLGYALLDMQKNLKKAKNEAEERKVEEKRQKWITEGIAKFGALLNQNNNDLNEMSYVIMKELVKYVDATQGSMFVSSSDEYGNDVYEQITAIAYDRRRNVKNVFSKGEGLIGRVVHEKLTIYMTEVPEDYIKITSGLGEANPRSILIVPLIVNEDVLGAIELVSFNKFEQYQIQFVEKIGETIASTLSNIKITKQTEQLLVESKQQQEELAAQEEEMRQNLEELQTTQEEASRREAELNVLIDALAGSVLIVEYAVDGKIININNKSIDLLGLQPKKVIGKHHRILGFDSSLSTVDYNRFWNQIVKGHTKKRMSKIEINDKVKYIEERYIPIVDDEGAVQKIVSIGFDFTKMREKEEELNALKNKLKNE